MENIEASLPKRSGKTRPLTKENFSRKNAIFLRPKAQFEYLINLKETMRTIHAKINELNAEAVELAERIAGNFGFAYPEICTPQELMGETDDE